MSKLSRLESIFNFHFHAVYQRHRETAELGRGLFDSKLGKQGLTKTQRSWRPSRVSEKQTHKPLIAVWPSITMHFDFGCGGCYCSTLIRQGLQVRQWQIIISNFSRNNNKFHQADHNLRLHKPASSKLAKNKKSQARLQICFKPCRRYARLSVHRLTRPGETN